MAGPRRTPSRTRIAAELTRASVALSTLATARMDADRPWVRNLSAEERSWVGSIVQAGIKSFVDWYDEGGEGPLEGNDIAASVFGAAPRDLAGVISLQQTVDLVRLSIEVVETNLDDFVSPADALDVQAAILRYGREVAFATAEVYARAAEVRGAWDARLEALVVDAVLRADTDETVLSRASAVGWNSGERVVVVLGRVPSSGRDTDSFEQVRRQARDAGMDALCAVQGSRLVVLLGGVEDPREAVRPLIDCFGPGAVVVGPVVADLSEAHHSARGALGGFRAAPGWPGAPRPVMTSELLAERALNGDGHARRFLVDQVHAPLVEAGNALVETLAAYLEQGRSIEATARALFVHGNTVRYRLGRVAEVSGYAPTDPRESLTLQLALILGRQSAEPV